MPLFILSSMLVLFTSMNLSAASCTPSAQSAQALHLVSPATSTLKSPVSVQFILDNSLLKAHFEVHTPHLHAKPVLGPGEYPYQYDVVEVFVSVMGPDSDHLPYYEFELSPYDQQFQVKINDPKKPFIENIEIGLIHSVTNITGGWTADLSLPLEHLGWKGDPAMIIGNAFSVFGAPPNRSYWSLYLPAQKKPNFHKPAFFQPLLTCAPQFAPPTSPPQKD